MPQVNPACNHLSASSIQAFKACPNRYRLAYREGLRVDRDTESQRVGTTWHAMHEGYAGALGMGLTKEGALGHVVEYLNARYADVPSWVDAKEWALERQVLLTSFIGYLWYWQNDSIEFLASEVPFDLPVHEPKTGMPIPITSAKRVGKIDHIVKWHDAVCALERKSTSRSIQPDSDYWHKSQKDTQVSNYALAFRDMLPFPNAVTAALYGSFYELPLSQGRVAIVDEADRGLLEQFSWHAWESRGKWYAATNVKNDDGTHTAARLHQVLIGGIEEGEIIDHINGDSLDNRRCNLRVVNQSVNRLNAGTRGTSFHKAAQKWVSRITLNGKTRSLGYFETEPEAHEAYLAAKAEVLSDPYERIGNTLYDCWHRPTIRPCMLTQAETKAFVESGEYQGQTFKVVQQGEGESLCVAVDDRHVEIELGKRGFAIRETVEMFGARLLQDIYARPDVYFARREVARTAADLAEFRRDLFAIYLAQSAFARGNYWFSNENQCRATFPCAYIPICFGPGASAVCDGKTTPQGFKRIFVDLTVNGREVEE